MGIYEFAGCVVSYEPLYGLLRRRMETYRSDTERQPDITLGILFAFNATCY